MNGFVEAFSFFFNWSNDSRKNRPLTFKNNAPFSSCISKINNVFIDNAEDLDVVMPIYNLIEYSKNYSKTIGNFGIITGMN